MMNNEHTIEIGFAKCNGIINKNNEVFYMAYDRNGNALGKITFHWLGSVEATLANKCCFFGKIAFCTPIGLLTEINAGQFVAQILWPDAETRLNLISLISDRYKEYYGFRPHHNWNGFSTANLEDFLDELNSLIRIDIELSQIEEQKHNAAVANATKHETGWTIEQLVNLFH